MSKYWQGVCTILLAVFVAVILLDGFNTINFKVIDHPSAVESYYQTQEKLYNQMRRNAKASQRAYRRIANNG